MRIPSKSSAGPNGGYALILIVVFMAIGLFILAGSMQWTMNSTRLTDRNNRYTRVLAAAEAATETVMARMMRDYQNQGVNASLGVYSVLSPASVPGDGWASQFVFSDAQGHPNQTYVAATASTSYALLNSEYQGLFGIMTPYRVVSNARLVDASMDVSAGIKQEFQLASIPVFQFAIFYSIDLEVNPGADMTVTGKVHGNANLYTSPNADVDLRFLDDVTAAGNLIYHRHPDDPQLSSGVIPTFDDRHDGGVASLTLPIGTNNSPSSVTQILDVPPFGESATSPMGRERFYNKADIIIEVRNTGVTVKSGTWNSLTAIAQNTPGTGSGYSFIKTNAWFYNGREEKKIRTVDIDVGALRTWVGNAFGGKPINDLAQTNLGHPVNSIYVDDQRTATSSQQTAVRVLNGQTLPNAGLSVITPRPIYVQGHYNAPDLTVGSTNTINTKPASLVGDSINVLSQSWLDSQNQGTTPAYKTGANTTVNAAFLGGIKESATISGTKQYSGGVENFPRFLENWSGLNLTYNGSMVVMFPSRYATGNWVGTGTYYSPPDRRWAFDLNFLQQNRLPPGTPQLRKLVRGSWASLKPGQIY